MNRLLTALALLSLLLTACGSDAPSGESSAEGSPTTGVPDDGESEKTPPELEPDQVVFVWSETGGCAMAGPNCARYEITADGTVRTYRQDEPEVAATARVGATALGDWLAIVASTDTVELVGRLGPGEMTAAFDGVDFGLEAPHAQLALSSVDVEFDQTEPLFQAATQLAGQAQEAAPLEFQQR